MSQEDVVRAAQRCLHDGDREAASFLTSTLFASLQGGFTACSLLDVIDYATASEARCWEHMTTVHFLLTIVSSFFRRKVPSALKSLEEVARSPALQSLTHCVVPRFVDMHRRCLSATVPHGMVRRMCMCVADCIAMLLLLATHNIVTAAAQLCQQYNSSMLQLDLLRSAMSILADASVQIGPICRSANRLAMQKRMDVVPHLDIAGPDAPSMLLMCVEFLANYSTLAPQEQCPAFFDAILESQLWQLTLSAVASGSEDASHAVASLLCSLVSLEDDTSANIARGSMRAALAHGSPRVISLVFNGVLEGPIGDVLLRPELSDLCAWVEQYFLQLSQQATLLERDMLERSVMLLVGGLRPQGVPTIEDDDDEDDMAFMISEIVDSNAKKVACVSRLEGFLNWCTATMTQAGASASSSELANVLDGWIAVDADQWEFDGPESFDGATRTAVALERLFALRPTTLDSRTIGSNLLLWGSSKCDQLLRSMLGGTLMFDDEYGGGVAWYLGQLFRSHEGSLGLQEWQHLWCLICRSNFYMTALHLLRSVKCFPSTIVLTGEHILEFVSMYNRLPCPDDLLRQALLTIQELQCSQRAESPMLMSTSWASAERPVDVRLCALGCSWASCSTVPFEAIDCCFELLEQLLLAPSALASLAEDATTWKQLGKMCAAFTTENEDHVNRATHRLCFLLQHALTAGGFRDKMILIACSFCRGTRVRGTWRQESVGAVCRDGTSRMTTEDPLPYHELTQACASAVLFAGHIEWFKEFVVWVLRAQQILSLFRAASMQLIVGLAEGALDVISNQPRSLNVTPWAHVCDAVICYITTCLGDNDNDASEEEDELRCRMQQSCANLLFCVASRPETAALSALRHMHNVARDAADVHEVLHRLRTLCH